MSSNSSPNSCFFFFFSSSCALDCECVLPNTLYGNSTVCNETTGQCTCKPRIGGRQCDRCHENAYNTSRGCVGKCGRAYIQIPPCLRNSCQCIQRVCDVFLHLRRLTCMRRMHGSREQMMIMILISKKKKIARAFRRLSSGNLPGVSKMYPFKFILVQNNLQPKGTI